MLLKSLVLNSTFYMISVFNKALYLDCRHHQRLECILINTSILRVNQSKQEKLIIKLNADAFSRLDSFSELCN